MKSLSYIIGLGVVLILLGAFLTGIHNARVTSYSQIVPTVTTGGGVYSDDVTLIEPLFQDAIPSVLAITSSLSDPLEAPSASAYVPATKVLTVIGLKAGETRNLTITYDYGSLDATSDTFMNLLPLLLIVGGVICASVGVWGTIHK
jgi:hypothetical protein